MNINIKEKPKSAIKSIPIKACKRRTRRPVGNPKSLRGNRGIQVVQEDSETSYAILLDKNNNCTFSEFE